MHTLWLWPSFFFSFSVLFDLFLCVCSGAYSWSLTLALPSCSWDSAGSPIKAALAADRCHLSLFYDHNMKPQQWVIAPGWKEGRERWGGTIQEEGKNISGSASIYSKVGELRMRGVGGLEPAGWGVFWSTPFINKHTDCSKINRDQSCQWGADGWITPPWPQLSGGQGETAFSRQLRADWAWYHNDLTRRISHTATFFCSQEPPEGPCHGL